VNTKQILNRLFQRRTANLLVIYCCANDFICRHATYASWTRIDVNVSFPICALLPSSDVHIQKLWNNYGIYVINWHFHCQISHFWNFIINNATVIGTTRMGRVPVTSYFLF